MMSTLPGLENHYWHDDQSDELTGMISNLIEVANQNYLKYLAASASHNTDAVWERYTESYSLEHDINTLTKLYELSLHGFPRRTRKQ
jgi:hypothetical protein